MKDTRGPEFPIPDSVPDELIRIYGAEARFAVRSRRSWRTRHSVRVRGWMGLHDPWYLVASALLWLVILAGFGGALALAAIRWPVPTLETGILGVVALASSAITWTVMNRRASRRPR
jgi:hypothetical protein